jgi:O-antigen/teichoic acid export membrane protein
VDQTTARTLAAPSQRTAWLNSGAKLGGTGLSFLLYLVLTRTMTPEAFGDFAVVFAWLAVASSLACFSTPLVLVRFIPENLALGHAGLARGVAQFSFAMTTAISAVLAGLAAAAVLSGLFALPRDLGDSALVAAALLVPSVLLLNLAGFLAGLKRVVASELLVNVTRPALMLATLSALWAAHRAPFSTPTVLFAYLVASLVILLACVGYSLATVPPEIARATPRYALGVWARSALGFIAVALMAAVNERIDLLVMGWTAAPAEVAVYAVAARFAQTVTIAATAVGAAMAPHLVERLEALQAGRRREVQRLLCQSARTIFYMSLLAFAGFAILGPLFLKLFGSHYESAYAPLLLLAAGQSLSALFGPAAVVATLVGAPRVAIAGLAVGIVVNATLNLLFVPTMGATGAALATAAGAICASAIAWGWTRRRLLLDTSVARMSAL